VRGRPHPAGVVAEFLRKGLGSGPVVVSDLEAMAHAAGLLADGQLAVLAPEAVLPGLFLLAASVGGLVTRSPTTLL
jgi:hypothetical protein